MQKKHKERLLYSCTILFFIITVFIVFLGNDSVAFMMDDNWYSTRLYDEEVLKGFGDVISAQIWHFFNWGGRSIAHGILQLTLLTGDLGANILNVLFNVLLSAVICKAAKVKGIVYYAMVCGMLYGLNANWMQTMCWQSGAANYLYMTTFILFFLWLYVRELEDAEKDLPGVWLWILPLGLMAGWSNENMGPTVWVLSAGIIVYLWIKERKWKWWMLTGNITCLVGSALVVLAPGNFVRAEETVTEKGLLWQVFLRCYSECDALLEYLAPALIVLAFTVCLGVGACGIKLTKANIIYLLGALLSWGAMILSPHYPDRATFGTMVFMIGVSVSIAGEVIRNRPNLKPWLGMVGGVIWLRGMFLLMEYTCIIWGWIK